MIQLGIERCKGAVLLDVVFAFKRPKSRKHENFKTTAPDLDKHIRAVLDALSGIAYEDDRQVVAIHAMKVYSDDGDEWTDISITSKSEGEKG